MTADRRETRELAVHVFVQAFFGTSLIMPLREPGGPWSLLYAALTGLGCLAGAALIAFCLRNCVRLWRSTARETSARSLRALGIFALVSGVLSSGPLYEGVWRWDALLVAVLAAYFLLLGRGLVARTQRTRAA